MDNSYVCLSTDKFEELVRDSEALAVVCRYALLNEYISGKDIRQVLGLKEPEWKCPWEEK